MVADALDALHDNFAGCETLAFADLSTQMILVTNSATVARREALDALCSEAILTLGTAAKVPIGTNISKAAIVLAPGQTRIFLRALAEPGDVLCCVFAPGADVASFLPAAQACLEQISSGA